jgi:hypothetical protein
MYGENMENISMLRIAMIIYMIIGLVYSLSYYTPLFLRALKKENPKVVNFSDLITFIHFFSFFLIMFFWPLCRKLVFGRKSTISFQK